MSSYWVNFAGSGDPNGPGLPEWPVFDEAEQEAMIFNKTTGAQPYPNLKRIEAFDAYYAKLREEAKIPE
jgi:para-nitrobenzyl esterase